MKYRNLSSKRGFTIIELMIVLIIVAILVALAYPSYIDYVRKARRGEAQQLLLNWSINQEIFRSNNTTYAATSALAAPTHDNYILNTVGTPSGTGYTLRAVAQGDQAKDKTRAGDSCATLTISSASSDCGGGVLSIKCPKDCWGK